MNNPRKHHYLPRFYLSEFSANGRSLVQIDKASGYSATCNIKDVASIRDYHRLDAEDIDDPNQLERTLSTVEGKLAKAAKQVLQGGIDGPITHAHLIELVSMLRVRIPATKRMIEQMTRQVVRHTGVLLEKAGRLPKPPTGLEETLSMENVGINVSNWFCLQQMFQLAENKEILKLLCAMRPTLLKAAGNDFFLTCDQPVAVYSPSARPAALEGVALEERDVVLSLPLSRSTLLQLDWEEHEPSEQTATSEIVEEFNRRTVIMASNYVFASHIDGPKAGALVERYGAHFAGMQPPQRLDSGDAAYHICHCRPVYAMEQYPC